MRVIPIKHYDGKIPAGYGIRDFVRFDQNEENTYGVLYSGERISVEEHLFSVIANNNTKFCFRD